MATTAELTETLAKKQAERTRINDQIVALQQSAAAWDADAADDKIRSGKKDKQADLADQERKRQTAINYRSQASALKDQITQIDADMKAIRATLQAKDEQGKILAEKGISQTAKEIEANATADAIKTSSTITAQAQAKALETQSAADAQAQKTKQYVVYGILIVLFIAFVLFLLNRIKKLKKS